MLRWEREREGGGSNDSGVVWENMWHLAEWLGQNTETCRELLLAVLPSGLLTAVQRTLWTLRETPCWCLLICTVTTNTPLPSNLIGWQTVSTVNCGHHQAVIPECEHTETKYLNLDISHFYSNSISDMCVKCRKVQTIKQGLRTYKYNYYFIFRTLF
jgi:hypothetical protein